MPNLVALESVSLVFGTTTVLDTVSLGVSSAERVGVVGRNGSGKSTLLRVLAGVQRVDSGRVTRARGTGAGLLDQRDVYDDAATVRQIVTGARPEHEWAGDARTRNVLAGLLGDVRAAGVGGLDVPVGRLSGGERRRVALAALLVDDPDVLLLDEPTNHLDVDGVAWLAAHLAGRRVTAALVAVTHDRWFLDAVASATWEIADGSVHGYDGGYAAYVLARAERERVAEVGAQRRDNLLRKELAWLRRGAPARTAKPRFRIEAASALIADEPAPRDAVVLTRTAMTRLGRDVVDLVDASVRFGERAVLDQVTWRLAPGERVGLLGPNGAGKSTLLQALDGEQALDSGRRSAGRTVLMRRLSQDTHQLDALAGLRVIQAVEQVRRFTSLAGREVPASELATRLGFSGSRLQTRVGDLSGGERRRLQLLRLLMDEPNVVLLDEPTNDLDIETLTSLEDVFDGWAGTLVVVSHDRYLLERMCDRQVALLGDGRLRDLPRGVEQYLEVRRSQAGADQRPADRETSSGSSDGALAREARKQLTRAERALARLDRRERELHEQLAGQATDPDATMRLSRELADLGAERARVEQEWLAAAESEDAYS